MPGRKKQVQSTCTNAILYRCTFYMSLCYFLLVHGHNNNQIKTTNITFCSHKFIESPPKNDLSCNVTNKQQAFTIPGRTWLQIHPNSSSIHFDSFLLCLEQQPHSRHPQSHTLAHGEGGLRQRLSSPRVHLDLQAPKRWQLTFEISKGCQVLLMEEIPNNHPTCMTPCK